MIHLKYFTESSSEDSQLVKDLILELEEEGIKVELDFNFVRVTVNQHYIKWWITIDMTFPGIYKNPSLRLKESKRISELLPELEFFNKKNEIIIKWINRLESLDEFAITSFDLKSASEYINGSLKYHIGFVKKENEQIDLGRRDISCLNA